MHTPSDRVQLREIGDLRAPGNCALCGNGTCLDGYVDLDIYYDWEGNVYLCMNCAKQTATVIGCLLPDQSRYLETLNENIAKELKETKEKLSEFQQLDDLFTGLYGSSFLPVVTAVSDAPEPESAAEQSNPADVVSITSAGKSKPPRPTTSRRSDDASRPKSSDGPQLTL